MGECDMKNEIHVPKDIYIPMFGIIVGELLMSHNDVSYGLGIHAINLLAIVLLITLSDLSIDKKNVLQSLILLILLRIINLSIPQLFTIVIIQYPLIYGIMFIPIYSIIKSQHISAKELGIDFKRFYIYLPVAVVIGAIAAIFEYKILGPIPLIEKIEPSDIILIVIIMFIFVGMVEEIIFRSILQTRIEKVLGPWYAILLSGSIFGIMHASYGIINEILFASIFGIILGYIFHKTRNLPFVVSIHGTTNVILFGILPYILT